MPRYDDELIKEVLEFSPERPASKILDELQAKYPGRELPDERTIRRWRAGARKRQKQIVSGAIVASSIQKHFDDLADIARFFAQGLGKVERNPKRDSQFDIFEYTIYNGDTGQGVTREQLSSILDENVDRAQLKYNPTILNGFLCHLKAEYPDIQSKGIRKVIEDNPLELIETLNILAFRRNFKGICPICKDLI